MMSGSAIDITKRSKPSRKIPIAERNQIWACFRVNGASSIASVITVQGIKKL
jgi:hypothetical protein